MGTEKRLELIAKDIVEHFKNRLDAMDGKAMVVRMSRRICVDLYRELTVLRPEWHDDDYAHRAVKVVMTGSASDLLDWQQHIRNKPVGKPWPTGSVTPMILYASFTFATCGSPGSTRPVGTRCTWTSRCGATA